MDEKDKDYTDYNTLYIKLNKKDLNYYQTISSKKVYTKLSLYYPTTYIGQVGLNLIDLGICCEMEDHSSNLMS